MCVIFDEVFDAFIVDLQCPLRWIYTTQLLKEKTCVFYLPWYYYYYLIKFQFRNNYFIGPNFENAVGFFVGGEESLLLSNFGSETSE